MVKAEDNLFIGYWVIGIVAIYVLVFCMVILCNLYRHYRARCWLRYAKRQYNHQRKNT